MDLIEAVKKEIIRCRQLLKQYEEIGLAGIIGKQQIDGAVENAEKMLEGGEILHILAAYQELKNCN